MFLVSNDIQATQARSASESIKYTDTQTGILKEIEAAQARSVAQGIEHANTQTRILNEIQTTEASSANQSIAYANTQARILNELTNGNAETLSALRSGTQPISDHSSSESAGTSRGQAVLGVKASVMRYEPYQEIPLCGCDRHRPYNLRSPRAFSAFIGLLSIWCNRYPFQSQKCTKCSVNTHRTFVTHMTYYFPSWFLWRMLDLTLITSSYREPFITLAIRTVHPNSAEIFLLAERNDGSGIQRLLANGSARPNDISEAGGQNALSVSRTRDKKVWCEVI